MLQCVAVCFNVARGAQEVWLSVLQCAVVCSSVLQCFAVCCSVLQCVAVLRSVSQCVSVFAVCCSVWHYFRRDVKEVRVWGQHEYKSSGVGAPCQNNLHARRTTKTHVHDFTRRGGGPPPPWKKKDEYKVGRT